MIISPSYSFTRPADTTQYGANDLIANDTDAADVVPMRFNVGSLGYGGRVFRVRLYKDDETVTAASFKIHLFNSAPVVTNGDNGAYAISSASLASYIGAVSIDQSSGATVTTSDAWKDGSAALGFSATSGVIYGLLEAIGAYAPASGETFTVTLDIEG